jgi:hypothetical protein
LITPRIPRTALIVVLAASSLGTRTVCGGQETASPASTVNDHGVFLLSVGGRPAGTETFDIRSIGDRVEAEAKIELLIEQEGKVRQFKNAPKLVLNSTLQPLTYAWSQKSPQSSQLEVDFRASPAKARYRTVAGGNDHLDFALPKDVVVLDYNVIHHYQLLVDRYRRTAGGKQAFRAFVPQEATPGSLEVEEVGLESVEIDGRVQTLRHLVVTTELSRIDLWVDDQQRLSRLSSPAAQLEVVRKR